MSLFLEIMIIFKGISGITQFLRNYLTTIYTTKMLDKMLFCQLSCHLLHLMSSYLKNFIPCRIHRVVNDFCFEFFGTNWKEMLDSFTLMVVPRAIVKKLSMLLMSHIMKHLHALSVTLLLIFFPTSYSIKLNLRLVFLFL